MSITGRLRRTSPAQLEWLLSDVDRHFAELGGSDPDDEDGDTHDGGAPPYDGFRDADDVLDVHQSWDVLHRTLVTAADEHPEAAPAVAAVLGGQVAGPGVGHGPLRWLSAAQVAGVAAGLAALGPDARAEAWAATDVRTAYSPHYGADGELGGEAMGYLDELVAHYAEAASRGEGMLLWLT